MCLLLLASCVREYGGQIADNVDMTDVRYPITVEMELPQQAAASKSSYADVDFNRITDLNIFIYYKGNLLNGYSGYYSDVSSLMLSFPYDKNGFNIYMVGNVGPIEPPENETEIGNVCYLSDSYDDFRIKGFPVANVFPNYVRGAFAEFRLKRLVGQYNITLHSSAEDAEYFVKDVRLRNCALDVYPFSYNKGASVFVSGGEYGESPDGDYLTQSDLDKLNRGDQVSICFLENLQGELLPGNTDRRKKIPSTLEAIKKGLSGFCTYMEITADITTKSAVYTDAKFRFYLGQNETTDFSIKRNTLYNISLDFTQNMVSEQEWRIEADEPQVNTLTLSKDVADVVCGIDDYILIRGPKMEINYQKSDESNSESCSFYIEDVVLEGVEYQKLTFHTEKALSGFYPWGVNYRDLAYKSNVFLESVEKYNGNPLITKMVSAYVYDFAFPVFLRVVTNDSEAPYQLEAVSDAPVNFAFDLSAELATDEGVYKNSTSVMSKSADGFRCSIARFPSLYNSIGRPEERPIYFRRLDVKLSGLLTDCNKVEDFYMGDGGQAYWGPGASLAPKCFSDLNEGADIAMEYIHSCSISGCVKYVIKTGDVPLFIMAPQGVTCNSVCTTGTSNCLTFNFSDYKSGGYMPFYIANGGLRYAYPVTLINDEPKYLDDSGRKSLIFQMCGPGRDVFYPNGTKWGNDSEMTPSRYHKFGYTAGLVKQFFGNIHTWQIYQDYECQFYMTINDCTVWPGASNLDNGFVLPYNL